MPITGSFSEMRHDADRTWYRCSDLVAAARNAGVPITRYQLRRMIAALPPPTTKKYGHWHYEQRHMDAVLVAVEAMR